MVSKLPESELTQTQAIGIGAYTILAGVRAMHVYGLAPELIVQQLLASEAEVIQDVPETIIPVIVRMAHDTVDKKYQD